MFSLNDWKLGFLSKLKECTSNHVTFGDGAKEKVIGKGDIAKPNLPMLQDVRLSQLDQHMSIV